MGRLADGACTVKCGETTVMVTAVSQTKMREGQSWFPMSVEYKEKAAAAGRFPGGYFKREGRPTEKEILTCRMTDRPLRPLFPKGYLYDTQIVALLLSRRRRERRRHPEHERRLLPPSASPTSPSPVRSAPSAVGRVDGEFVVNPTFEQREEESDLDLVYVWQQDRRHHDRRRRRRDPRRRLHARPSSLPRATSPPSSLPIEELAAQVRQAQARVRSHSWPRTTYLEIAYQVAGDRIEDAIYTPPTKSSAARAVGALRDEVTEAIHQGTRPRDHRLRDRASLRIPPEKSLPQVSIMEKGVRADGRDDRLPPPPPAPRPAFIPRVTRIRPLRPRRDPGPRPSATLAPIRRARSILDNYAGGPEDNKHFILHYQLPPLLRG